MNKDPLLNDLTDISRSFSPELQLLLYSLQAEISAKDLLRIRELLEGTIDWNLFLDLAEHHRVYPLICKHLESFGHGAVPESVISVLKQRTWINATKALQMTGELINVLKAMEAKGIRVVVLKGFPLGYKLYANIAQRPSKDLDLLVWPEDLNLAMRIIESLGFECENLSSEVTQTRLRMWMKRQHHFNYWHKNKGICLELHWRLGSCNYEIPLNKVEDSLHQTKISGQVLNILGSEEQFIYLVKHGANHEWFRLKWLCDISAILWQGDFSWERLYRLSKRLECGAMFNQSIILAHILLQAPVPDEILCKVTNDHRAKELVRMVIPFITTVYYEPTRLVEGMALYKHRRKYKARLLSWKRKIVIFLKKFSPIDRDMELISLPDHLYFIYYLIRPFTWFGRKVKILVKRLEGARS